MIDEKAIREAYAKLAARVDALEKASGMFASDAELDDPRFGDPIVKFDLRDWRGPSYVGKRYSQCSPEFLEKLAERLAWTAANPREGKEKYVAYDKKDSGRARSWARRLRSGAVPPPPEARALAGEAEQPSAPDAPSFEAPAFEAPSFDDVSDADEDADTPMF